MAALSAAAAAAGGARGRVPQPLLPLLLALVQVTRHVLLAWRLLMLHLQLLWLYCHLLLLLLQHLLACPCCLC
jgi:hypothetical protein